MGKSQQCIGENRCECPNLTCDFRLWLSLVTPVSGFSCVLKQAVLVSVHSGAQLALAGNNLASHTHSSGPVRTAFCHSKLSRHWSELREQLFS